jgi:hypothetical protein
MIFAMARCSLDKPPPADGRFTEHLGFIKMVGHRGSYSVDCWAVGDRKVGLRKHSSRWYLHARAEPPLTSGRRITRDGSGVRMSSFAAFGFQSHRSRNADDNADGRVQIPQPLDGGDFALMLALLLHPSYGSDDRDLVAALSGRVQRSATASASRYFVS